MEEVFTYMGKSLDEYSKEELIKIAKEGWAMYFKTIDISISSMRLVQELHNQSSHPSATLHCAQIA
jgi:hypothetical protein